MKMRRARSPPCKRPPIGVPRRADYHFNELPPGGVSGVWRDAPAVFQVSTQMCERLDERLGQWARMQALV